MAKEFSRMQRINEEIQRAVAKLVLKELKSPRLGLVTITKVDASKDLSHAKIFVSCLNPAESDADAIHYLNDSAKYIRLLLAKEVQLRVTPQLRFVHDATIVKSAQLSALIDSLAPKADE